MFGDQYFAPWGGTGGGRGGGVNEGDFYCTPPRAPPGPDHATRRVAARRGDPTPGAYYTRREPTTQGGICMCEDKRGMGQTLRPKK